jgi:hypothetical protein
MTVPCGLRIEERDSPMLIGHFAVGFATAS